MLQAKFSVKESQALFLSKYKAFGFKDKSAMLRAALDTFKHTLENDQLERSADLYAALYAEDGERNALTESAVTEWPE